jgi:hypothetical protein
MGAAGQGRDQLVFAMTRLGDDVDGKAVFGEGVGWNAAQVVFGTTRVLDTEAVVTVVPVRSARFGDASSIGRGRREKLNDNGPFGPTFDANCARAGQDDACESESHQIPP